MPKLLVKTKEGLDKRNPIDVFSEEKYTKEEIQKVNNYIYSVLSDKMDGYVNRVLCYRNSDIELIVSLYDSLLLGNIIQNSGRELEIEISHKKNEGIGRSGIRQGKILLTIYVYILTTLFKEDRKYSISERCYDRLECMMQTVRHELVHIIGFIYGTKAQKEPLRNHGSIFKILFKNIFDGSITTTYSSTDVDIYPERGKIVGKKLKKGKKAQIISTENKLQKVTILEEPILFENDEKIKVITKDGKQKEVKLLLFKSPVSRKSTRKNTMLSPISKGHEIEQEDRITNAGYPYGLARNQFERRALREGVRKEDIRKEWRKYVKETEVFASKYN